MHRTVCFVQKYPSIRVYQEAVALKQHGGYDLILLCEECDHNLFDPIFDKIIYYGTSRGKTKLGHLANYVSNKISDAWNLPMIIRMLDWVDIFHLHAEPNNVPRIVIKNSHQHTVFDAQDFTGISSGIENISKKEREDEKYCFESANGICHKGPQLEVDYYRQHGYRIECPEIQWMGGCNEGLFKNENGNINSVVYTGSLSPDERYEYKYFIPLIRKITRQGIDYHIYPSSPSEERFKKYKEAGRWNPLFSFHKHVRYDMLSSEISNYGWGLMLERDIRGDRYIEEKPKVGMATKVFSYMEAGIPIIVSDHLIPIKKFVEENKIGFSIKEDEIYKMGEMMMGYDYKELKNNVLKTRVEWSLRRQSVYLDEFYSAVLNVSK